MIPKVLYFVLAIGSLCSAFSGFTSKTKLLSSSPAAQKDVSIRQMLSDLIRDTMTNEKIFLIYDKLLIEKHPWLSSFLGKLLKDRVSIKAYLNNFNLENYDNSSIKGSELTPLFLTGDQSLLIELFSEIKKGLRWAPTKMVIIYTNESLKLNNSLFSTSIQRSTDLFFLELTTKNGKYVFKAYTIYPYERAQHGERHWKYYLGLWRSPRNKSEIFVKRTEHFAGKIFDLSTICGDFPLLYMNPDGSCTGVNIDILTIIGKKLNFNFTVQNGTADGEWEGNVNGTWTGMVGEIFYEKKDFAINLVFMFEGWNYFFDVSPPFHIEGAQFLLKIPPPFPEWQKFFMPFSFLMWLFFLIAIFAVIFTLMVFLRIENLKTFDKSTAPFMVLQVLLRQSISLKLYRIWFSFFVTTWILFSFIMTSAYTGNLISFMTIPRYPKRMETLKELSESKKSVGMLDYGDIFKQDLIHSSNPYMSDIGKRLDIYPIEKENTYDLILSLVKSDHHSMFECTNLLLFIKFTQNITGTYVMKEEVWRKHLSFVFRKHSQLTAPIGNALNRLVETGVYGHIFQKHLEFISKKKDDSDGESSSEPLRLEQLQTPFFVLVLGYIISGLTLLLETSTNKQKG